jgi:hypothetical protein
MTTPGGSEPRKRSGAVLGLDEDGVRTVVVSLIGELGTSKALKRVQFELRLARRARSRRQYAFWAAVGTELHSSRSGRNVDD